MIDSLQFNGSRLFQSGHFFHFSFSRCVEVLSYFETTLPHLITLERFNDIKMRTYSEHYCMRTLLLSHSNEIVSPTKFSRILIAYRLAAAAYHSSKAICDKQR